MEELLRGLFACSLFYFLRSSSSAWQARLVHVLRGFPLRLARPPPQEPLASPAALLVVIFPELR